MLNYIFHVAGVVKSKHKEGYLKEMLKQQEILLEVATENKSTIKRFLVVSSQTVTGPSSEGNPVTEETEANPFTTYGRSKLKKKKLLLSFKDIFACYYLPSTCSLW